MNSDQKKFAKRMTSWFWFKLFGLSKLPLSIFSGFKIIKLNDKESITAVNYKWLNKNPFRSTFWAVLGMAAELSTGAYALLATLGKNESVAVILVSTKAEFLKKATDVSTFTCEDWIAFNSVVDKAIETNESQTITSKAVGVNKDGDTIATFEFTWSFKKREN